MVDKPDLSIEYRLGIKDGDYIYPIESVGDLRTEDLYRRLKEIGIDVVLQGREVRTGEYHEYIGCPGGFKRKKD